MQSSILLEEIIRAGTPLYPRPVSKHRGKRLVLFPEQFGENNSYRALIESVTPTNACLLSPAPHGAHPRPGRGDAFLVTCAQQPGLHDGLVDEVLIVEESGASRNLRGGGNSKWEGGKLISKVNVRNARNMNRKLTKILRKISWRWDLNFIQIYILFFLLIVKDFLNY